MRLHFPASSLTLALVSLCAAQNPPRPIFSIPPADAPELARRGSYPVGVRTVDVVNSGQVDILHFDAKTGKAPLYDRPLRLEVWYPATIPQGSTELTTYESSMPRPENLPDGAAKTFQIAGKALRDATPLPGRRFPLVIVSHGYPGSRTFLTYLTENLASKGYIVVAIDHTDSVFGETRAFTSTLLNRSNDQLFTLDEMGRLSRQSGHFLNGLLDPSKVAIVGYSMGGYGALASAGAAYSVKGMAMKFVPGGYFAGLTFGSPTLAARRRDTLKAVVAIAPWGAQPPYNAWDEQGLAGIHIPSLFIAGDLDDVADYPQGIQHIFSSAINSERCMLTFLNARHNVGGNPAPDEALAHFTTREFFEEPAWRKDRITAINQHFITAFLDLYLKGDESRRAYIHVSPQRSNDGKWPQNPSEKSDMYSVGGANSSVPYWKGFQRRWAVGMEMKCESASRTAK